jgi:hypothetical protein
VFSPVGCLAADLLDCRDSNDPYYRYVMFGLDQMLVELFGRIQALVVEPYWGITVASPHFKYIYEVIFFNELSHAHVDKNALEHHQLHDQCHGFLSLLSRTCSCSGHINILLLTCSEKARTQI